MKSKYRNKQSCRWWIDWDSGDRVETNTNTRKTKPEVDWWIDWETGMRLTQNKTKWVVVDCLRDKLTNTKHNTRKTKPEVVD